jgi:hypothetical protein
MSGCCGSSKPRFWTILNSIYAREAEAMCDHVWIFEARTLSTQPVRRRCGMCGVSEWNQGAENRAHRHANFGLAAGGPLRSTRGRLRIADRSQSSMSSAHCGPIMWVLDCAFALCRALVVLTFLAGFVKRVRCLSPGRHFYRVLRYAPTRRDALASCIWSSSIDAVAPAVRCGDRSIHK